MSERARRAEPKCLVSLQSFDKGHSFCQLRELGFVGFERAGVDAAAGATQPHRVFQVQHLVIEQVFDGVART